VQIAHVLEQLFALFEKCEIEFMVGGSFASGAWGEPRHTNDIDIVADVNEKRAECLLGNAHPSFQIGSEELEYAIATRSEYTSFQLLHTEALFKIDVFLLTSAEFDQSAFSRKLKIEIVPGLVANCTSPEDMVLQKLRWYELGNRVSDRQWHDVIKMLEVQRGSLNDAYIADWARRLDLTTLLIQARSEAWNGE
jgi:hypothetical protein